MISKIFMTAMTFLLIMGTPGAFSKDTESAGPSAPDTAAPSMEKPVMLGDKVLFQLATEVEGLTLEKRAKLASKRIKNVADAYRFKTDSIETTDFKAPLTFITIDNEIIMAVIDQDAVSTGKTRQQLAADYAQVIRTAIEKYRRDRSFEQLVSGILYTTIATLVLMGILLLIVKLKQKIERRIDDRFGTWKKGIHIQSVEIIRAEKISEVLKGGLKGVRLILTLIFIYIYLQTVFGFFPRTRQVADRILDYVLSPLATLAKGFLDQIPNLLFIVVLALLTKYVLKLLKTVFEGVEKERVRFPGFYPEWARSTYRLVSFLVIAFAVVIAFPYIPGSESLAFKGVSVFIGLLLSLGSQSAISNIIAGFALTYRRAFRVGDRVKIGDHFGDVLEVRLQVTILRTPKNEEIIVPNSEILNSHVINYSAEARERGLILHTSVTIGYDTPWRQVRAMLLMAARKTPGLLDEPAPFVLEKSLDDFYVTYELNVYTDKPDKMASFYAGLHQNILDVFNEYGVQIMSPNYESDRSEPAIVPKERWYAPPAEPPGEA